jgi:hypothetical protein
MLQNLHCTKEIIIFIKELLEKPGGKFQLARIVGMARNYEEILEKKSKIEKALNLSRGERVVETTIIDDIIAIVKVERNDSNGVEVYYHPVINGKRHYEVADTFDYALAIALGQKYGVGSYAPQAIHSILQMDKYEERKRPKTFIEKCVSGEESVDAIDEYIEMWHNSGDEVTRSLAEYLGMSQEDYFKWVKDGNYIYQIVVNAIKKVNQK